MGALFGPAGNAESFETMGYKKTEQIPQYLEQMGLSDLLAVYQAAYTRMNET